MACCVFRERQRRGLVDRARGYVASCQPRRLPAGEYKDKAKGLANETIGNTKQAIGKATDNERLRAEAEEQQRKGEALNPMGKVKGTHHHTTRHTTQTHTTTKK